MRRLIVALGLLLTLPRVAAAQGETIEYYAHDAIGSVRVVFTVNGTVLGRQDYGPFGQPIFSVPAMPKEGFGAQEKDGETDQAYFHARMFQARTGRFTRVDPIFRGLFEPQSWNRYAYALNDPASYVDPDGLDPFRSGVSKNFCKDYMGSREDPGFKQSCPASVGASGGLFEWTPLDGFLSTLLDPAQRGGRGSGRAPGRDPDNGDPGRGTGTGSDGPGSKGPKVDDPKDCGSGAVPDYVNVQFSAGAFFGGTVHVAMDRYANAYFGIGPSIGRADPVSASVTFGYLTGQRNQSRTVSMLTGSSVSGGGGFGPGLQSSSTPGVGGAYEPGFFTPQIGFGYSYSWKIGGVGSSCQ